MIIVTGGAGFIGSCVVRSLNDEGIYDVIIIDDIGSSDKWLNMRNKRYVSYYHKNAFINQLDKLDDVTAVIHMGAQSATTERDFDYLWNNNFEYTKPFMNLYDGADDYVNNHLAKEFSIF